MPAPRGLDAADSRTLSEALSQQGEQRGRSLDGIAILLAIAGIWVVIVLTAGPLLLMTVRYAAAGRRMMAFQMALGAAFAEVV
jgi:hypothetical protein